MTDVERENFRAAMRRYESLIASSLTPVIRGEGPITVETSQPADRGQPAPLPYPLPAYRESESIPEAPSTLANTRFGDGIESRAVYGPLTVDTWLQNFRAQYETLTGSEFGKWDENLRAWADLLESELGQLPPISNPIPAASGTQAAQSVWIALALHVAGKIFVRDAWTDYAADTFGRLARAQSPAGSFLTPTENDNLEMFWYDELTILHAAASYAAQTEDRPLASAVLRATNFHFREIQPDHATAQPWGLFAFIWNPQTRSLADQLLHSMRIAQPEKLGEITLMLLQDSLHCVRLFL